MDRLKRNRHWTTGHWLGASVLVILLFLHMVISWQAYDPRWRVAWFDWLQENWPRETAGAAPVRVIALQRNDDSLADKQIWPRDRIGDLVDRAARDGARVIGLDMMLDRQGLHEMIEAQLGAVSGPDKTAYLAERIAANPVIVSMLLYRAKGPPGAGRRVMPEETPSTIPESVDKTRLERAQAILGRAPLMPNLIQAHAQLRRDARAEGVILDKLSQDAVIREMRMVYLTIAQDAPSTVHYALAVEMLAEAEGTVPVLGQGPLGEPVLQIGRYTVPLDSTGAMRLYQRPFDRAIYADGHDVYRDRVPDGFFRDAFVLIAPSPGQLEGFANTPLLERAMTAELVAQAIEQITSGAFVLRPGWLVWAEIVVLALLGVAILRLVSACPPQIGVPMVVVLAGSCFAVSIGLFVFTGYLVDGFGLGVDLALVGIFAIVTALFQRDWAHQSAEMALLEERAQKSRLEGELDVARRIQMGLLPAARARPTPTLEIACHIEPARMVGGDFYDHIVRPDGTIVFMIADVSGKGVSASLFMALAKSQWKSAALRSDAVSQINRLADHEISRDNHDRMFVTGVTCLYDPATGRLAYSGAGHDMPILARPGEPPRSLPMASGPPLGLGTGRTYREAQAMLMPGDLVCLFTDGLSEAMLPDTGDGLTLFGTTGVGDALGAAAEDGASAADALGAVMDALRRSTHGAEQADDRTLVVVRVARAEAMPQRTIDLARTA